MKNAIVLTVSFLLLVSCNKKEQQVDTTHNSDSSVAIEAEGWYEDVFPASKDSVCIIPEYVYSTNRMQRYIRTSSNMKHLMDSLYYFKGESIRFPKPSGDALFSIGDLTHKHIW